MIVEDLPLNAKPVAAVKRLVLTEPPPLTDV